MAFIKKAFVKGLFIKGLRKKKKNVAILFLDDGKFPERINQSQDFGVDFGVPSKSASNIVEVFKNVL